MQLFSTSKRYQFALAIVVAIVLVVFFAPTQTTTPPKKTPGFTDTGADYYMHQFRIVNTQRSGGVAKTWITGKSLNHFPNNTTMLELPDVAVKTAQGNIWQASANSGTMLSADEISLDGQVQIQQVNKQLKLNTDQLTILLNKRIAETLSPIKIITTSGVVTARGMHYNFEDGKIKLLADVKADYVQR